MQEKRGTQPYEIQCFYCGGRHSTDRCPLGKENPNMIALSYSRMKDLQCPHRFRALHVDRTHRTPETVPLIVGRAVHEIMAQYRRHCIDNETTHDADAMREIMASVLSGLRSNDIADNDLDDAKLRIRDVMEKVMSSDAALLQLPDHALIETRLAFDRDLSLIGSSDRDWVSDGVAFRAIADYVSIIGDSIYITDDKTGWSDPDPTQLEVYATLVPHAIDTERLKDIQTITCAFCMLSQGRIDVVGSWDIRSDAYREMAHDTRARITAAINDVNTRTDWPAVPCDLCEYCPVDDCPVRKANETALVTADRSPVRRIPDAIECREEAELAVEFLAFADGVVSHVKDLLRTYISANGPVTAAGKIAEIRTSETWSPPADTRKLFYTLTRFGIPDHDVWGVFKTSETDVKRLLRRHALADRWPMIEAMGRKKSSERFGLYKSKQNV